MSLESGIADLTKAANDLVVTFNGKKTAIEQAVAAAIAAIPEATRTWYVDQVNGSDTNVGNVVAAPFKTIKKAMDATPNNGQCNVFLLSDYTLDTVLPITVSYLQIYGFNAVSSGLAPKLKPKYYQTTDAASGIVVTQLSGFGMYCLQSNIEIRNCDIVLPSPAGLNPAPNNGRLCSFIKSNAGSNLPPVMGVMLEVVVVTKAADFFGSLIGLSASTLALGCSSVTFPSDFAGKYVTGIAAGADTKTISNITTNLGTL